MTYYFPFGIANKALSSSFAYTSVTASFSSSVNTDVVSASWASVAVYNGPTGDTGTSYTTADCPSGYIECPSLLATVSPGGYVKVCLDISPGCVVGFPVCPDSIPACPTPAPTTAPTPAPTPAPTEAPATPAPTEAPTPAPTAAPTPSPTEAPATPSPTPSPTQASYPCLLREVESRFEWRQRGLPTVAS